MARLNIEDQFWLDAIAIASKFYNHDEAIGNAVRFFRHAQEKHKHGLMVTDDEFKALGFSEHLIGVFAERVDGGVRAIGADKHFDWLKDKVEAGRSGGRVSAKRSRDIKGRLTSKHSPSTIQAKPSTHQASPSPSPSYSNTNTNTAAVDKPRARKRLDVIEFESAEQMGGRLKELCRDDWQSLYPDQPFIQRECIKAFNYYRDNPRKKPTTLSGWKRAMNSWLERGWPKHQAGIPGYSNKNAAPLRSVTTIHISERGAVLASKLSEFLKLGFAGKNAAISLAERYGSGLGDLIDMSWGTWASKPEDQGNRDMVMTLANYEKRNKGAVA